MIKKTEEIEILAKETLKTIEKEVFITSTNEEENLFYDGFIIGYQRCQVDVKKDIEYLINMYNKDILKLENEFKNNNSLIVLREISTLQMVVTNLESNLESKI